MLPPKTPPHLITLIILTGFSPLTLNMFAPSLANIADEFATDYSVVTLAISGYLALTAIVQLIVGPLSDRIGRRPVLLGAITIFALASVGCVLAQDIETFLICRIFQGGMTAGYTLSMTIVRDTHSESESVSLIGYIAMSMALAPMLGPVLGGVLDATFGWRSVFIFYSASGVILFLICLFDLGETKPRKTASVSEPRQSTLKLLSAPLFWAFSLCGSFSVGAFYMFIAGTPIVASSTFNASTSELGFYVGSITFGFMIGGFFTGRLGKRLRATSIIITGRIVAFAGLFTGLALLLAGVSSPFLYFGATTMLGLGNGLTVPGCNTGLMSVNPSLAGSAAGIHGALSLGAAALFTAITGALVTAEDGAVTLLVLLLVASAFGLAFAILAARLRAQVRPAE